MCPGGCPIRREANFSDSEVETMQCPNYKCPRCDLYHQIIFPSIIKALQASKDSNVHHPKHQSPHHTQTYHPGVLTEFDYFVHQLPRLFNCFSIYDEFIGSYDVSDAELNSRKYVGETADGSPVDDG